MAIARVQSTTANSGAASATLNVVLGASPVAGNVVIMAIGATGAITVTGTGIHWTMIPIIGTSTTVGFLAIGRVQSGASATITITSTISSGGLAAVAAEYSGTGIVPDQQSAATATGTSAASGATPTTTAANELWIGALAGRSAVTFSAPTNSFSIVGQDKSTIGAVADRSAALLELIVSSTGTANPGATVSSSVVWTAIAATFRETTSGSSVTGYPRSRLQ